MSEIKFSFEKLEVWQKSTDFSKNIIKITEEITSNRKHYRLLEQLESASTSVALNIAEGCGRFSKKEFIHFLYVARGSLYETVTLLVIFKANDWITLEQLNHIKDFSDSLGKMISGLINSLTVNN